jgi:hypothetical protein
MTNLFHISKEDNNDRSLRHVESTNGCGNIRGCVLFRHFVKLCIGPKCKVLNTSICLNWKQTIKWWVSADFILRTKFSTLNSTSKIIRHDHFKTLWFAVIIHTITWAYTGDNLLIIRVEYHKKKMYRSIPWYLQKTAVYITD